MAHNCVCFIVPPRVLERFSVDPNLSAQEREQFAQAAQVEQSWRRAREATAEAALVARATIPEALAPALIAAAPSILVFDCGHGRSMPGTPVADPTNSGDPSAVRAFDETTKVVEFYRTVFGRNSLDNAGMTLISSIHYSVNYNNAGWTGTQMRYGDGDGNIFIDFTRSNDVIGHELAHGVTEFTSGFVYRNESGGLNESMSDVFGSMYRQWRAGQTVAAADWLIGSEIMGPGALARGYTCLRDMAVPDDPHCLSPQPTTYAQYQPGMDPHDSSGIPNLAFYKAAMAIGGRSWEKTGKVWYQAIDGFPPNPNMTMQAFADRTRTVAGTLFAADPLIRTAINAAWMAVGL